MGGTDDAASFEALYWSLLFLAALYVAGDLICRRGLRIVPSLTGQIVVGILFGPYVLKDALAESWITLGNVGLTLLICQAGMDMDFTVLRDIGPRGALMAVLGSILPIAIATGLSFGVLGLDLDSSIAAGCSFGPTSAGIAMNVLEQCDILKTKIGQLVVAIAIVDDILALVVLSQLKALTGETVTVSSIVVPILSALLWLLVGGAVALYAMPVVLDKLEEAERVVATKFWPPHNPTSTDDHKDADEKKHMDHLWHIIPLLLALLPATYYTEASYLMGAFLVGLSFGQNSQACQDYGHHLNPVIRWLMRVFFGATIGFTVPITWFNDATVIGQGCLLSLALLGKMAVGPLLTPSLHDGGTRFDSRHARDCAIVGFSMAGEAEFAFLVAGFGLSEGLLTTETYASVVFAILLSTIISPVLLRSTLALFPVESPVEEKEYDEEQAPNTKHFNETKRGTEHAASSTISIEYREGLEDDE